MKIIVPARLRSARLPDKPLADIAGKAMIVRTLAAVAPAVSDQGDLIAAVDDARVAAVVEAAGFRAVMTDPDLASGTDRCAAAARALGFADDTVVVNVQGDEPLLPSDMARYVGSLLMADQGADIATLAYPMTIADMDNPNIVKVVRRQDGRALYFSRAGIPFDRDGVGRGVLPAYRHIGIYAYRVSALSRLSALPVSALEQLEMLEQLRALDAGMSIQVGITQSAPPHGVDTPDDLVAVRLAFDHADARSTAMSECES